MQEVFLVTLAVALAAGSLMGFPLSIPPLPPDPVIERAVPEKALVHISLRGVAAPRDGAANLTEQMLTEKEVQRFISEAGAQIVRLGQNQAESSGMSTAVAKEASGLVPVLLSRPLALTIDGVELTANGPQIKGSLVVNAGDAVERVQQSLERLLGALPPGQVEEFQIGGQSWSRLAGPAGAPQLEWGFQKKYFVIAAGPDSLRLLLDRLSEKNRPAPAWRRTVEKRLPVKKPSSLVHVDAAQALALVASMAPSPFPESLLKTLGIDRLAAVEGFSGLSETGVAAGTFLNFSGTPTGLFAPGAGGLSAADLKFVPADAVIAQIVKLDLATTLEAVLQGMGTTDPAQAAQIRESLEQFRAVAGLDIQKHLLAPLGDVWTLLSMPETGLGMPNLALTASVRDRKTLATTHKALLGILRQVAGQQGGAPKVVVQEDEFAGTTIFTLQLGPDAMMPLTPAWCLTDDRLVVTLSPQLLRTLLARKASDRSLADVPEVAEAVEGEGTVSLLGYQEPMAVVSWLSGVYELATPVLRSQLAKQGMNLQFPQLPARSALVSHARPSVAVVRHIGKTIAAEGRSTIPLGPLTSGNVLVAGSPATLGVAVGLMVPAVDAARAAARRTASSNNLKQIGLGMLNYEAAHNQFPAPAICDKQGKPLLSWRVEILPYIDENKLYKQFHRDEPWDSEHNKKLVAQIPQPYQSPETAPGDGRTVYLLPVGEKTLFPSANRGPVLKEVRDGLTFTLLVVEASADRAVPWTKPDDLKNDPKKPLDGLTGTRPEGFLAGFGDGHVSLLPADINADLLRALFTPAGGEKIDMP